jgi:hypothetical protein
MSRRTVASLLRATALSMLVSSQIVAVAPLGSAAQAQILRGRDYGNVAVPLDATARSLQGTWYTPFGPIEMRASSGGTSLRMGGEITDAQGRRHEIYYIIGGPKLFQIISGNTNFPAPFVFAADGFSFEVDGNGPGVSGRWRATRSDPYATSTQPTAEQATLLRVLEGRWRERDGDYFWRLPVAGQDGTVDAFAWQSGQQEAAAAAVRIRPSQDGRTLVGRFGNGDRVLIERNSNGQLLISRRTASATARSFELIRLTTAPTSPSEIPSPSPGTNPHHQPSPLSVEQVDATVAKLKGAWTSPFGRINFIPFDNMGIENLQADFTNPETGKRHTLYFTTGGGLAVVTFPEARTDRLTLNFAPDGRSFTAQGTGTGPGGLWRAKREAASEPGAPPMHPPVPNTPPLGAPPTSPVPNTPPVVTPPGPVATAAFKPLNRINVRVDRVVVARGYPTHQVHAFLTVKNTSASPQYFTSGFMKAVLADADGAGWERSQPYRASGEPAALFSSTPVIQPGGELKVRYIFLSEPDAQLRTLTLSEGGQRAEFPVRL